MSFVIKNLRDWNTCLAVIFVKDPSTDNEGSQSLPAVWLWFLKLNSKFVYIILFAQPFIWSSSWRENPLHCLGPPNAPVVAGRRLLKIWSSIRIVNPQTESYWGMLMKQLIDQFYLPTADHICQTLCLLNVSQHRSQNDAPVNWNQYKGRKKSDRFEYIKCTCSKSS